jgi:hypothetical protein
LVLRQLLRFAHTADRTFVDSPVSYASQRSADHATLVSQPCRCCGAHGDSSIRRRHRTHGPPDPAHVWPRWAPRFASPISSMPGLTPSKHRISCAYCSVQVCCCRTNAMTCTTAGVVLMLSCLAGRTRCSTAGSRNWKRGSCAWEPPPGDHVLGRSDTSQRARHPQHRVPVTHGFMSSGGLESCARA